MRLLFKNKIIKGLRVNVNEAPSILNCESCIAAKAHRAPFPQRAEKRADEFGDLTHTGAWESLYVTHTPGRKKNFILFIDDYTIFTTVKLMKDKASLK